MSSRKIFLWVLTFHFLFLILCTLKSTPPKGGKLVVKTRNISLKTPPQPTSLHTIPKPSVLPNSVPLQKKIPHPKKTASGKQEKASTKNGIQYKPKQELLVPRQLPKIQATTEISPSEIDESPSYLIQFLQDRLTLPEKGKVQLQLTFSPQGRVKSIQVLNSESSKNLNYLKNTLPDLIFPCFNGSDKTITFSFQNEK